MSCPPFKSQDRSIAVFISPRTPQRPDLLTAAGTFTQLGPQTASPDSRRRQPSAPSAPGTPPTSRRLESLVVPPAPRKTPESQRKHRADIFASRVSTRRTRNRLLTEVGEISTAFHSYLRELEDTLHQNIPYLGEDSLIQLWHKLDDKDLPLPFISLYPHITCLHFLTRALNSNITGNPPETAPYIFVRLVHDRPSAADLYNHLQNIPHEEHITCSVWNVPRTPETNNHFNALTDFLHSNENADLPWRSTLLTFGFWDPYVSISSSFAPDLVVDIESIPHSSVLERLGNCEAPEFLDLDTSGLFTSPTKACLSNRSVLSSSEVVTPRKKKKRLITSTPKPSNMGDVQEVVTALGNLVKVMTSKQNSPDFRDMASFLPPTRFSGRVAADAAAHWESFQRFLEVMHTQGKITQAQQAAKLQEILSYFQSTLKSPAVDWFKHVRPTIKSVDELHHAFRRKYNHYGKTSDEQEEYWARMSWDPEETDFNAFREEVETLGKILDKTTQNIFYKLQKAMPQAFRAVIADCTNADELEDKITRLTKLSVHLHQKTSAPANQSKTALQDLLFHTLAGASAEAPAPAPSYQQPMAYQQQAPPPYHIQYYTPPQPVPENVDYFGPGGHPMGTMRASKFLPTHPDNQSFSSQAASSHNRQNRLPPLSQPPPALAPGYGPSTSHDVSARTAPTDV